LVGASGRPRPRRGVWEASAVRLGVFVSNEGDHASRLGLTNMAVAAEEAGADGLWVSDHLLMLDEGTTEYPFSRDGVPPWDMTDHYYEALVCCAWIAAVTRRCRVGTAILVLPQRNVLEVAKMVATLDRLSSGRFVLGVGAGWYSAEMEALGYDFGSRGRRLDEMLEVLRDCWSGRPVSYDGTQIKIPDRIVLEPRPAQSSGVPLLIGGMSAVARRRAARHGDGWLAIAGAEDWDPELLSERFADVRGRRDGREPFEFVVQLNADPTDTGRILEIAREAGEAGVDEIILEPPWLEGVEAAASMVADVKAATPAL
jgi:probable F420-dependent oxidoreductase